MADRIQQRRDTAARWSEYNPILLEGEIGIVTDNPNQYKIGDGVHTWKELPFRGFDGTLVHTIGDSENSAISQEAFSVIMGLSEYPAFSEATFYPKGKVVNYNGLLYQFTANHEIGAWLGTDAEEYSFRKDLMHNRNLAARGIFLDYDHLVNFSADGSSHIYISSELWDCAWIVLDDRCKKVEVTGVESIWRYIWYSDLNLIEDNYISSSSTTTTVPEGAKVLLLNLKKEENPNGYDNMQVKQILDYAPKGIVDKYVFDVPAGKNLINPDNLLYGYVVSEGKLIEDSAGILSNKIRLVNGKTYTMQGIIYYGVANAIWIAEFDKDDNYVGRFSVNATFDTGAETGMGTFTFDDRNGLVAYVRIVLQTEYKNWNKDIAQIEEGSSATAFEAYTGKQEMIVPNETRKIRILSIGNSYSQDALGYAPFLMRSITTGIELEIGILYQSGATLQQHYNNIVNQSAVYTYYLYNGGDSWQDLGTYTIQQALQSQSWDIILLQQGSTSAWNWSTHQPYLNPLIQKIYDYINYSVKFGWMMVQSRPKTSSVEYTDREILQHYAGIAKCAQRVLERTYCDFVIPVGTAVQNARRTSLNSLGDYGKLCSSDGGHLQEGLPCQLAAYTVCCSLLKLCGFDYRNVYGEPTLVTSSWTSTKNIPGPNGSPVGSTSANCEIAQRCVIMAINHPYRVYPNEGTFLLHDLVGNFFVHKAMAVRTNGKVTVTVEGIDSTDFLPINGESDIIVEGGWLNLASNITPIAFYDKDKNFISCWTEEGDGWVGNVDGLIYEVSASEIPEGSKFIRCCSNILQAHSPKVYGVDLASLASLVGNSVSEESFNAVKQECNETTEAMKEKTSTSMESVSDTAGHWINSSGVESENAAFHYVRFDLTALESNQHYAVTTGIGGDSSLSAVHYYDSENNWLGLEYPLTGPAELFDARLTVPSNAAYVLVNANNAHHPELKMVTWGNYYDLASLVGSTKKLMKVHVYGVETSRSSDLFYIRTSYNNTKDIIIVYYTNNNGLISPSRAYVGSADLTDAEIMTSTYLVSSHGDSTAPFFNVSLYWHLFAQHGYVIPRISNTAGMTSADVGAVWKDQLDRQYTIGDVTDSIVCLLPVITKGAQEGEDTRGWKTPNDTAISKLTHVSGGTVTTEFNTTNLSSTQLRPIMKSCNRKWMADGVEITAGGDYYCDEFKVSESQIGYDPASINVWFPLPVLDGALEMARFTWSYNFKGANCAVNTTVAVMRKLECQSYGACQQQFFLDKGTYKAMFLIPKLKPQSGIDPSKPFNSPSTSSTGLSYLRNSTYLIDENDPVDRQIGYLYDEDADDYLVGMAAGLSLVSGDTVKEKRIQNIPIGSSYGHERLGSFSPSNVNKFYIAAVNTAPFSEDGYNFPNTYFKEINYYVSYFDPAENEGQVYWYKDGSSYVIYLHCQTAQNRLAIKLPKFMEGLKVEVVEKTNGAILLTDTIQNGNLFVTYTNESNYIVLRTL